MRLDVLVADVDNTIFDGSVSEDDIIEKINEGLRVTAELVLLPKLETSGTVTTVPGANLVDPPATFSRNLFRAKDSDGNKITVYSSTDLLEEDITVVDSGGVIAADVKGICLQGEQFYYAPSPEDAETLTLGFYTDPTPLVDDDDEPSCIPEAHQKRILCNYAKWQLFEDVEDGIDGAKVNARRYETKFYTAVAALEGITTQGQGRPHNREYKKGWF
jgi:hypothetical protein